MKGTIAKVIAEKKFGFIQGSDGKQYFFHHSDLHGFWDDLVYDIGQGFSVNVKFDVVESTKGPRAGEVMRLDAGISPTD